MATLPLATKTDLLVELAEIDRERVRATKMPAVDQARRDEYLACLDGWERDLRAQLDQSTSADAA